MTLVPRLLSLAVFAAVFLFRITAIRFHNDGFDHIASAYQMTFGHLPARDFIEEGRALQVVSSFVLLELFGHNVLGELLFSAGAIALSCALAFLMAARASGSVGLGAAAAAVSAIAVPALYSYTKVLFPLLGVYMVWCYARRPTTRRLLVAGAFGGLAFLYRIDLVAYVAPAAAVVLALRHLGSGPVTLVVRGATYAAGVLVCVAPFLLYLTVVYSVPQYFRDVFDVGGPQAAGAAQNYTRLPVFVFRVPREPLARVRLHPASEGAPTRPIRVRWAPEVSEGGRRAVEARYGLIAGVPQEGRTWRYYMAEYSSDLIGQLVRNPAVEDTDAESRGGVYTVREVPPPPPGVWERVARAVGWAPEVAILPGWLSTNNVRTWLLFIVRVVPLAAAVLLGWRLLVSIVARFPRLPPPTSEAASLAGLTVSCALAGPMLMRDHFDRATDVMPLISVLAAWLVAQLWETPGRWVAARTWQYGLVSTSLLIGRRALAVLLIWLTVASTAQANDLGEYLSHYVPRAGPGGIVGQLQRFLRAAREPPVAQLSVEGSVGHEALVVYLNQCTRPEDYVLLNWFSPEKYFQAGRRFAGLLPEFSQDTYLSAEGQARAVSLIREQAPPIVVYRHEAGFEAGFFERRHPLIHRLVVERYRLHQVTRLGGDGDEFAIWVDARRPPARAWGPWALPCFA